MVLCKKVKKGNDDGMQNQYDGIEIFPRRENWWTFVGNWFVCLLH
ncbi:MAG: hypothetical protein ACJAYJ_003484 [Saprospiraceae bacterium]|jgi:hypothetical protein